LAAAGYFNDRSLVRVVHRERIVALSGARALLMQAAHPVAFEGFFASTASLTEPYERLARTARVLDLIGFGTIEQADRATRRVRAIHGRVRGELAHSAGRFAAGTPYAADDPELLLWILACVGDSALAVFERYVRQLRACERDAYWQDYRTIGRLFGLTTSQMPVGRDGFRDYIDAMIAGGDLCVTDAARELAVRIVLRPPVPFAARPLLEIANAVTVGLLPPSIRRGYRLRWDPASDLALRAGGVYARRVIMPALPDRVRFVAAAQRGSSSGVRPSRVASPLRGTVP